MSGTHIVMDHVFIAALVLFSVVEWRWLWPRCVRAITSGDPAARARFYRGIVVSEWLFTACVVAVWMLQGRPWTGLHLELVFSLRLGLGLLLALTICGLLWLQRKAVFARPERIEKVRQKLEFADPLIPHTPAERRMFMLVSITAGVCEEVLFRGFVLWYFAVWTHPILALVISSVLFGFGHIYLGLAHVPRTALVGMILGVLVLATGSLYPAIIIHAALDLNSEEIGFRAQRAVSARGQISGASPET